MRKAVLVLALTVALILIWGAIAFAAPSGSAGRAQSGVVYYVSQATGNDGNTGLSTDQAWQTVARVNAAGLTPGDTVAFARSDQWDEDLDVNASGSAGQPITFTSYGVGNAPVLRRLTIDGDHTIFENLVIDHQKLASDAVRVRAKQVTLRGMTLRNGARDGVDATDADGLLVDSCLIHHFLAGSFSNQVDAHGIVATDIQGLTIRNTEIHHVSGDSFQADPSRSPNVPTGILIEDSHFWTGPLAADFNQWNAGEVPGENAIDTKVADSNWNAVPRASFTIRNMVAHGWINDGFISNRAVFNMKEKIEAVFDGVTVYDAEIAFRLRGTRGNANNTLMNVVVYDVEKAIRAEDDLQNLRVFNSTFGGGIGGLIQIAGGGAGVGSWDFRNNAFLGALPPPQAPDPSNQTAAPADFTNSSAHDYHLAPGSPLVDAGVPVSEVAVDRDGVGRPQGGGYDVGAYELLPALNLRAWPGDAQIRLGWTVNTTLPATATWRISYTGPPGDQPSPIGGLPNPTRAYTLTGLTNYTRYSITLAAIQDSSPVLIATTAAMPSDHFLFLPLVRH